MGKDTGTTLFKSKKFDEAAKKYEDGEHVPDDDQALYISCWGNAAMSYIKLSDWSSAIKACNKVLNVEKINLKALYRRGVAKTHCGLLKEAKCDLMAAYSIDNKNVDVRKALAQLKETIHSSKKKEKAAFGGIFDKMN